MFEQDYIMRVIRQVIRMIIMLLFHFDIDQDDEKLQKEMEQQESLESLLDLVDRGEIDEAENRLYELVDGEDKQKLKTALLFYNYLNDKEDSFLEEHDFSRDEIRDGVKRVASLYGVAGMVEAFWEE
ncbi:MAG: hypothetical protein IJZ34_04405 [Lachnospiraceae bacterium]|nr:hypothetical protein [Lachnospiraceae bacterium]